MSDNQDSDILLVKEEPAPQPAQQIIPIEFSGDHQVVSTSNGQAIVLTLDPEALSALTGGTAQFITTSTSHAPIISSTQSLNQSDVSATSPWPLVRRARRSGIAPDGSCVNQYGRHFANGRPLPDNLRLAILKAYDQGVRPSQISRTLQVSHGCVSKILNKYRRNIFLNAEGQREYPTRATPPHIVHKIKEIKRELPHLVAWEVRLKLITDNICPPEKAPSISCITRILRDFLQTHPRKAQMHGDCGEGVVSSNLSTTESDSLSDISHMQQSFNSSDYSQLFSSIDGQSTIATTPTTTTTTIAQQQQQILTLLQEPLKNSLRPILPKQTAGEEESNNTNGQTTNNSNSPSSEDAVSQSKLDDCNNPLAGLNMPALVTALLTLSGQPCSNPWEPLWTNQEHLLMTSNGSAMKQIVYMGNNLWKLKSDDDIK